METTIIDSDIKVFYTTATSFPEGILAAHQQLHALVPFSTDRKYFGISRPENGVIVYKAAAEEINSGEAEKYHCDTMVLKKGTYVSRTIHNYMKDIPAIGNTFQELLETPSLDPNGYCVEWYINDKDVICMIPLAE
jgi:predicted transcriptional regulator YdeE